MDFQQQLLRFFRQYGIALAQLIARVPVNHACLGIESGPPLVTDALPILRSDRPGAEVVGTRSERLHVDELEVEARGGSEMAVQPLQARAQGLLVVNETKGPGWNECKRIAVWQR